MRPQCKHCCKKIKNTWSLNSNVEYLNTARGTPDRPVSMSALSVLGWAALYSC